MSDEEPTRESHDEFKRAIEATVAEDDAEELVGVVIDVAMAAEDLAWATDLCLRLAEHPDTTVRGNAIIGFTHLAERFGAIDADRVRPAVETALTDPKQYVREQAEAASEALGWRSATED